MTSRGPGGVRMDENLPVAIKSVELKVGNIILVGHVLSNGQRIFEADSMEAFFDYMASPGSPVITEEEAFKIARFVKGLEGN